MNTKRFTQIFARQLDWLDMGAKIVQQRDRLCDGDSHFRIDDSVRRFGPQSDLRAFENALPQHERRQLADALIPSSISRPAITPSIAATSSAERPIGPM